MNRQFTPEQLGAVRMGAEIQGFLPYLAEEVLKMQSAVQNKVYQSMGLMTFTPDQAFAAWAEMKALHDLYNRFSGKAKMGLAAERVTTHLGKVS